MILYHGSTIDITRIDLSQSKPNSYMIIAPSLMVSHSMIMI